MRGREREVREGGVRGRREAREEELGREISSPPWIEGRERERELIFSFVRLWSALDVGREGGRIRS